MPSEPMITIKDANGTMRQVPLSQLSQQVPTQENIAPPPGSTSMLDEVSVVTVTEDVADLAARAAQQVASETEGMSDMSSVTDDVMSTPVTETEQPTTIQNNTVATPTENNITPAIPSPNIGIPSAPVSTPQHTILKTVVSPDVRGTMHQTDIVSRATSSENTGELRVLPTPGALTTTVPNTHIFETQGSWDDMDHSSLLDETLTETDIAIPHSTSRPGMAAALSTKQTPTASPVMTRNMSAPASTFKKSNTEQFNEAFSAIAPRTDAPYTPGLKKVPMQDIVAATPTPSVSRLQPLGPVAEIQSMTLDDFRRIGGRGQIGIAELRAKFEILLKESIILYMQGVTAWHQSPLFRTYLGVIESSVTGRITIDTVLQMTQSDLSQISAAEWHALAGLHADIRL